MSHAMVITEFGGPDVLQWREVAPPDPRRGEVLIRVKAAAVGPTDLRIRAGDLTAVFPQRAGDVLGFEAAGVVEAVGEGAAARVGDEVAALLPAQGGYGELVATPVWHPKPESVTWEAAAALPRRPTPRWGRCGRSASWKARRWSCSALWAQSASS